MGDAGKMTKKTRKSSFTPLYKEFKNKVRRSFERQNAMSSLGITIENLEPGRIELNMPYLEAYTQQHGFMHAGILSTAMDSACGYAAFSLMSEEADVLTIEYKVNFMAAAKGDSFLLIGKVLNPGRTITVCQAEAYANKKGERKLVAHMTGTMMTILGGKEIKQ